MKICGIYKITSPSKKIYIGQSIDIIHRWNRYKSYDCKTQSRIYRSLKKYGYEKHDFAILCQCDKSELNNLEKYYVDLFQTFNSEYGLNLRDGGGLYAGTSNETRLKIGLLQKGNKHNLGHKDSIETKIRKSEAAKKCFNNGRFKIGFKHTKESKIKIGISSKGNKYRLGMKHSEESLKKKSESMKGKNTWSKGLKRTPEVIEKIREASKLMWAKRKALQPV